VYPSHIVTCAWHLSHPSIYINTAFPLSNLTLLLEALTILTVYLKFSTGLASPVYPSMRVYKEKALAAFAK